MRQGKYYLCLNHKDNFEHLHFVHNFFISRVAKEAERVSQALHLILKNFKKTG
jgi:hypothetical protein